MESVVAVLGVVTVIAAGTWFQYRLSRRRMWTPLWMAFSATAISLLFIVAGTLGHPLSRRSRFLAGDVGSPGVIWWEVGVGLALAVVSLILWRQGIQSIRRRGV